MTLIDRPTYLDRLAEYIGTPVVKVLTSMRRSGKSTLLALLHAQIDRLGATSPSRWEP